MVITETGQLCLQDTDMFRVVGFNEKNFPDGRWCTGYVLELNDKRTDEK